MHEHTQAVAIGNMAGLSFEELKIQFKRRGFIIFQRSSIAMVHIKGRKEGTEVSLKSGRDKVKTEMA